jgi:dihydroneopterin aldolase
MKVSSQVFIDGLRLFARHGVGEQERQVGADFEVSLRVHYNIMEAAQTDDVAKTVSYAELHTIIVEQMAVASKLLEHVAARIVNEVHRRYPGVTGVDLKIVKLNPPMGADCKGAGVELHTDTEQRS